MNAVCMVKHHRASLILALSVFVGQGLTGSYFLPQSFCDPFVLMFLRG